MEFLKKEQDIDNLSFNVILDRVIALDAGYGKFVIDVKAMLDKRWKDHQTNLIRIQEFKWPSHLTFNKWE